MRNTIFNAIIDKLKTVSQFSSDKGTVRVFDYPITAPDGYPYAVVNSTGMDSEVLDNQRDTRTYKFAVQIVGEKFGEPQNSQKEALDTMKSLEDSVMAVFDADNNLGISNVIRTLPSSVDWGYSDGNSHIILDLVLEVQATVDITF